MMGPTLRNSPLTWGPTLKVPTSPLRRAHPSGNPSHQGSPPLEDLPLTHRARATFSTHDDTQHAVLTGHDPGADVGVLLVEDPPAAVVGLPDVVGRVLVAIEARLPQTCGTKTREICQAETKRGNNTPGVAYTVDSRALLTHVNGAQFLPVPC